MLRTTVIAVVALALAVTIACAALAAVGVLPLGGVFALWAALQLAIVLAGFLFEQRRYKTIADTAPPGFAATPERFVDPETGTPVQVWFNAETGERRYIRAV